MSPRLPFLIPRMALSEVLLRDRVLARIVAGREGVPLGATAALMSLPAVLFINGVTLRPNPTRDPSIVAALSVTAAADSPRFALGIDLSAAARLIDAALGRPSGGAPASMESLCQGEIGALLYALDRAGKDWLAAGEGRFKVRGLLDDEDQAADYLGRAPDVEVNGTLRLGDRPFPIRLWCLAESVPTARRGLRSPKADLDMKVRVDIIVGWSAVSHRDLEDLAQGDKIVLDGWHTPSASGGAASPMLVCGAWRRFGRFVSKSEIQVTTAVEMEQTMSAESGNSPPHRLTEDVSATDAGEMNVVVRVEVGSLHMSVQQALDLVPGKVIRLDRPVGPEVRVTAGDKVLCTGTLVDVDGFMAVEIKAVVR